MIFKSFRNPILPLLFMFSFMGCTSSQQKNTAQTTAVKEARSQNEQSPSGVQAVEDDGVKSSGAWSADLSAEMLVELVFPNLNLALDQLLPYLPEEISGSMGMMLSNPSLRAELITTRLGLVGLGSAIDLSQPLSIHLLSPRLFSEDEEQAVFFVVPIFSEEQVKQWIANLPSGFNETSDGIISFDFDGRTWFISFDGHKAYVALSPKVSLAAKKAIHSRNVLTSKKAASIRIHIQNLRKYYPDQIEEIFQEVSEDVKREGSYVAPVMEKWRENFRSIEKGEIFLQIDSRLIKLGGEIIAQKGGAFEQYLNEMGQGSTAHLKNFPKESFLISVFHQTKEQAKRDLNDALELIEGWIAEVNQHQTSDTVITFPKLLPTLLKSFVENQTGRSAFAFVQEPKGGVTMVQSIESLDASNMQYLQIQLLQLLRRHLPIWMEHFIRAEYPKFEGAKVEINLKPKYLFLKKGIKTKEFEIKITWPEAETTAQKKQLEQIKKVIADLFGKKIQGAITPYKDVLLFSLGKSHLERIKDAMALMDGKKVGYQLSSVVLDDLAEREFSTFTIVEAHHFLQVVSQLLENEMFDSMEIPMSQINQIIHDSKSDQSLWIISGKKDQAYFWEFSVSSELIQTVVGSIF